MSNIDLVIPVYNNKDYLEKCIRSAIQQKEKFAKIVLVDDNSTEPEVRSILAAFGKVSNLSIVYEESNLGICGSQNRGLEHCTSEYVGFLDCDDILSSDACARARHVLSEEQADYFFSNRAHIDSKDSVIGYYDASKDIDLGGDALGSLVDNMFASHFKVIRRSALERIGGFEPGTEGIQDWDVALKISKFGTFCYLDEYLYFHRIHEKQTTSSKQGEMFIKTNNIRRRYLEEHELVRSRSLENRDLELIQAVKRKLQFSRKFQTPHFTECVKRGLCFGWASGAFSVVPLAVLTAGSKFDAPAFDIAFIYSYSWHDLGKLRNHEWARRAEIIYFVDSASSDSVTMARWFNSYFTRLVPMDEMVQIALDGYIESRFEETELLR